MAKQPAPLRSPESSLEMCLHRALLIAGGVVLVGIAYFTARGYGAGVLTSDQPADAAVAHRQLDTPSAEPTQPPTEEDQPQESANSQANTGSGVPPAVVTSLGIPVAVLKRNGASYSVRTPCGMAAQVSAGTPIESARIVIDPGHGGRRDTGAVGPNGLVERDLNLTLSRAVLDELARRGISATTTRSGNYPTLHSVRAAFADALGADALISIHHNAPTWSRSDVPGTEVFVQSATPQLARDDSARLGGLLYEEITAALATFDNIAWSGLPDAGVLRVLRTEGDDAYGMIRRPSVPTVLVEYGYLSNPSEARLFATGEYIRVAANATADAIEAYLHSDRQGSGFIEQPRTFNPQSASIPCNDPALE